MYANSDCISTAGSVTAGLFLLHTAHSLGHELFRQSLGTEAACYLHQNPCLW